MNRRLTLALSVALTFVLCGTVFGQESTLADRLPVDRTVLYLHVPMKALLSEIESSMKAYDAEQTAVVQNELKEVFSSMREWLAGAHEFNPQLLDHWAELNHYMVLMAKKEPIEFTETMEWPAWDEETGEEIPGKTETETYTHRVLFVFTYALEAPDEEIATEFVEQFLGLAARMHEKNEAEGEPYKELETDTGSLWQMGDDTVCIGRNGRYLTFSSHEPVDLWQSLATQTDQPLSQTAAYQRLKTFPGNRVATALFSPKALVAVGQSELDLKLEQAKEAVAANGEDSRFALMNAQSSQKAMAIANALFSLDKLDHAGLALSGTGTPGGEDFLCILAHADGLSPVIQKILDGTGRPFAVPPVATDGYMAFQLDMAELLPQALATIGVIEPKVVLGYEAAMAVMRSKTGTDLQTLFGMLGGDFHATVRMEAKEVDVSTWEYNEETEEFEEMTSKQMQLVPNVTFLIGLKDADATQTQFSGIFANVATNPQAAKVVRTRTFMETPVFCFGNGVSEEDSFPDGKNSFALAVVGRYLTLGSWENITKVIRTTKTADGPTESALGRILQANSRANMLAFFSRAFQENVRAETEKLTGEDTDPFEEVLANLTAEEFEELFEDAELAQRVRDSVERIVKALRPIVEKAEQQAARDVVITGQHEGNFYEINYEELK